MKLIPLTKGYFAKVDDEDYEKLSIYKWHVTTTKRSKKYYAERSKNSLKFSMAREILNLNKKDKIVDHIDMDTLNNQKYNLRIITQKQNTYNRIGQGKTSIYKGVYWDSKFCKWYVKIMINGKTLGFRYHNNEIQAALVYNLVAQYYFGEYAYLNPLPEKILKELL